MTDNISPLRQVTNFQDLLSPWNPLKTFFFENVNLSKLNINSNSYIRDYIICQHEIVYNRYRIL